ncbi:MAG: diguanylate cyclase [Thiobacillus sp.]|nr:diguanylate cyclase [Thiobacillus sp.]
MKRPSALVPVIAGFSIMLILMAGVTAIGVTYIRILSNQLTAIVAERNQKAELATTMRAVHEARYQSLMLASNMADPFLRDEEILRFSRMAMEFIQARDQFLSLPLDESEFSLWTRIRQEVRAVEAIAEQIIALSQEDRLNEARNLVRRNMLPTQESMMREWTGLVAMQRAKNQAAMDEARQASARARHLTVALSAGAFAVGLVIAVFVIRLSRRLGQDLYEEKERAQVTLHAIGDAVVRFDADQRVRYLNPVAEQLLGFSAPTALDQPVGDVLRLHGKGNSDDLSKVLVEDTLAGNRASLPDSTCLLSAPGLEYEVEGSCAPIHTTEGEIMGGVLVLRDVTEAREMHRRLLWQADHDSLTSLMNRRAFEERLARILGSKRSGDFPLSILYIDLDHFKPVNDTGGHAAGDELLRQLANLMQSRIRDSDFLARMGGDEFAIVLNACPDTKAEQIAEDIRDSIAKHRFEWQGRTFPAGASMGVVHVPPHWSTLDECLAAADAACYKAKQQGRDNIVVHQH